MNVVDAVATALQQDSEAAKTFMVRLNEIGYTICKRDDPSMPKDALSLMEPPTPNLHDTEFGDVQEGPIR